MASVYDTVSYGGAIADGSSHPLSGTYGSLAAAQAVYPFVTSLTQQIDWAALQKCCNDARVSISGTPTGKKVTIAAGRYYVDEPVVIDSVQRLEVEGYGGASLIEWHGGTTQPVWKLTDVHSSMFRRIHVQATNPRAAQCWLTQNGSGSTFAPQYCTWEDCSTNGGKAGWRSDSAGAGGDQNNDQYHWLRCEAGGYSEAGWQVNGGQIHQLTWHDCRAQGGGAPRGVHAIYGGYLIWTGGFMSEHSEADFDVDDFVTLVAIDKFNSEASTRFIRIHRNGSTANTCNLAIRDSRWSGLPPSDPFIIFGFDVGPALIENCWFNSDNARKPLVGLGVFAEAGVKAITHINNSYRAAGASAYTEAAVYAATPSQITDFGNLYQNPSSGVWEQFDPG